MTEIEGPLLTYDQMSNNDLLSCRNSLLTIIVVINHRNIPWGPRWLQASSTPCLFHWTLQIRTSEFLVLLVTVSRILTGIFWYRRSGCRSIDSIGTCSASGTLKHLLNCETWNTGCISDISSGSSRRYATAPTFFRTWYGPMYRGANLPCTWNLRVPRKREGYGRRKKEKKRWNDNWSRVSGRRKFLERN